MARMTFNSLPDKVEDNLLKPGIHTFIIKDGEERISSNKKENLVFKVYAEGHEALVLEDHCALFNEDGTPNTYGQFKLRKIMEATNTIPEGEFTAKSVIRMLKGKKYQAELISKVVGEKEYLNFGKLDTYLPAELTAREVIGADPSPVEKVAATTVLENDDDL